MAATVARSLARRPLLRLRPRLPHRPLTGGGLPIQRLPGSSSARPTLGQSAPAGRLARTGSLAVDGIVAGGLTASSGSL